MSAAPAPRSPGTMRAAVEHEGLHRPTGRARLGLALALTTVAMWGVLPIGLKIALQGMDALTLTWYRFVAAAGVLAAILAARGSLPPLRQLRARHWRLLAVATVGLAGNYACYVLGLARTNAGTAQVVIQLAPMLLAIGGIFVFGERVGAAQWAGLAVLLVGLGLFSRDQVTHVLTDLDRYYTGVAFLVAAAVSWACYGLAQKQLLGRLSSPSIMVCIYAGGAVLFTPLARPSGIVAMGGAHLAALVFCIVNMLAAYATFAEALAHWEASRVGAVLALGPLATLAIVRLAESAMPTLLAPEPVTAVGLVGACLVVAGSLVMALVRR